MIDFLDATFESIAPSVGLSKDHLKLIVVLCISFPLSVVLKWLPQDKPCFKNLFNIGYLPGFPHGVDDRISLFFLVGMFDLWTAVWALLISSLGTYALAFTVQGPRMPWFVFVFVMTLLTVTHLIRQFNGVPDTVVNNTGYIARSEPPIIYRVLMVVVQKLTAFAWNVRDGRQDLKV
jgi:lysophospholipid acyltransferase